MKKLLAILLAGMMALMSVSLAAAEEGTGGARAGDIITFGRYPQAAEGTERTPIGWIVLEVQDGKALVISRYGLDAVPYNTEPVDVTWENCTLRAWLNSDFLNAAFTPEEQAAIPVAEVDNSAAQGYSEWNTNGGNNTQDQVFLLSWAEANRYFGVTRKKNPGASVAPTAYAAGKGAFTRAEALTEDGAEAGYWWLRSPGGVQFLAACVGTLGTLADYDVDQEIVCVRPAMWLDLNADISKPEKPQDGATPQGSAESFVFRNGVTWGMSREEVYQCEGKQGDNRNFNGFQMVDYPGVTVSGFDGCKLSYWFDNDRLLVCYYNTGKYAPEKAETLAADYSAVYGEPVRADPEALLALYARINEGYITDQTVNEYEYYRWDAPGGTQVWMLWAKEHGFIEIIHVSPEIYSR